jgi:hypothetical protein
MQLPLDRGAGEHNWIHTISNTIDYIYVIKIYNKTHMDALLADQMQLLLHY